MVDLSRMELCRAIYNDLTGAKPVERVAVGSIVERLIPVQARKSLTRFPGDLLHVCPI